MTCSGKVIMQVASSRRLVVWAAARKRQLNAWKRLEYANNQVNPAPGLELLNKLKGVLNGNLVLWEWLEFI